MKCFRNVLAFLVMAIFGLALGTLATDIDDGGLASSTAALIVESRRQAKVLRKASDDISGMLYRARVGVEDAYATLENDVAALDLEELREVYSKEELLAFRADIRKTTETVGLAVVRLRTIESSYAVEGRTGQTWSN